MTKLILGINCKNINFSSTSNVASIKIMDASKEGGLLTRFARMRKKPQQPLTDLTELYSQIANESIYYLKLEEKHEYKKAVLGWKALNTHVLYELTQIEHHYPNTGAYTRDEISIQNGVRELYHRSLSHLERVSKLCQEDEKSHEHYKPHSSSLPGRPRPPTANSRSMLKTLREPGRLKYNRNHPSSAPNITSPTSRSNSNVNFTTSKPLGHDNVFQGFDEDHNLIEFSDDEPAAELEEDAKSDTKSDITFDFDVHDYFDDYLDMDQEELKRLETLNNLEGVQKSVGNMSIESSALDPKIKEKPSVTKSAQTSATVPKEKVMHKTTKKIVPKAAPKAASRPGVSTQTTRSRVPAAKPKTRPTVKAAQSTPVLRSRVASPPPKSSALINKRVVRKNTPAAAKTSESLPSRTPGKPPPSKKGGTVAAKNASNGTKKQPAKTATPTSSINSNSSASRKRLLKSPTPPPVAPTESAPKEPEVSPDDEKILKEALEDELIDQMRGIDKTAAKQIFSEIVVHGDEVHWDDIAGLESAKSSLKEAVVYPFLRPDLFRGLREPVRGMLLFGPPGTGKTMLARAVATESNSTFFSISASSLTSKYLGESEKLVRALFAIAKKLSPSIVFVDEIDSIMGSRNNDGENESSRRIKNEFLIQWSSLSNAAAGNKEGSEDEEDERVLVLAATNLPWSIDEAARRRFVRRQYIPLPEPETRKKQMNKLLAHQTHTLTEEDFEELLALTDGYSGSDITSLAKDAAMGPLRELGDQLLFTPRDQIRPITLQDVKNSLEYIKPSVSKEGLTEYEDWAKKFGSSGA